MNSVKLPPNKGSSFADVNGTTQNSGKSSCKQLLIIRKQKAQRMILENFEIVKNDMKYIKNDVLSIKNNN